MANWDSTFDNKPAGTDLVGEMDDYIKATRQEVRVRMAKELLFDMTDGTTQGHQGLARMGSSRVWWSKTEPTSPLPDSAEVDNNGKTGRVWVVLDADDAPTGEIKVYSGSAWVSVSAIGTLAPTLTTFAASLGSGLFAYGASTTGAPSTNAGNVFVNAGTSDAFLAFDLTTGFFYTGQRAHGTGAVTWRQLWDSGTDGTGSGLDADTVDSYHANQLAKTSSTAGGLGLTGARYGNTQNRGDLYNDLSDKIPTIGNTMIISGSIVPATGILFTTTYAERMSASSIRIYGTRFVADGTIIIDYYDFASGSTDKINMAVAW